jgi:methionyl-tRNA synthetase
MSERKIFIGAAWPYANGPLHLGHIAGCLLPADIFARYCRMKGYDTFFVSGSDMHGTPITITADKESTSPEEVAERNHASILETISSLRISYDIYTKTHTQHHFDVVQGIFLRLKEKGYIETRTEEAPYCASCGKFMPDRYIEGQCPHCGYEQARGDQCDNCGKVLDAAELIDPICRICGGRPQFKETEHFYLLLSRLESFIKDFVEQRKVNWRPNTKNNTENFLRDGLKDRAITRDLTWGVPIPIQGYDDKRIYVWFEAVCGYLSASKLHWKEVGKPDMWESYWKDPECRHYYFLAKDNIPFHTIIWPAILAGYGGLNLPYDVPSNEYLQWDGEQFSKSRGHGVTVNGFLKDYPVDPLRFYLSMNMPERGDSNFDLFEFVQKNNTELLGAMGNYLHRVVSFMSKNFGKVTQRGELSVDDKKILETAQDHYSRALDSMESVRLKEGIHTMMDLVNEANRYFNSQAPWKLIKEDRSRCETVLNVSLQIGRYITYGFYPYIPHAIERWYDMLKMDGPEKGYYKDAFDPFKEGMELEMPEPLFTKLEPPEMKEEEESEMDEKQDEKGLVAFEDFMKMDLRVGRILSVEDHPKADRLYIIKVDIGGSEPRQIVAGLKKFYSRDDMVGKKIIVVSNLQPAKLRGVDSNGMLLAAESGEIVSLLTIDKDVEPGSKIH